MKNKNVVTVFANYRFSLTKTQQSEIQLWLRSHTPPEGQDFAAWQLLHDMTYATSWTEIAEYDKPGTVHKMSELLDLRVDALPNGKVKIIGLTPEPIDCTRERFVALLRLCATDAWQNLLEAEQKVLEAEDEGIPRPLSDEFGGL